MSRADVEAGERRWLERMNGGDAAGVAAIYATTARLMPPNMDILAGRDAIEAFCKEFTAMGAKLSFDLLTVHEAGDLSVAVGTYELDFQPPGAEPQHERGKYIEVWRREPDGEWRIADDIFNSSEPAPSA
jgi:uncharacterized protein (TIGR02246 family)